MAIDGRVNREKRPGRWIGWSITALLALSAGVALLLLRLDLAAVVTAITRTRPGPALAALIAFVLAQIAFAARWWSLIDHERRPAFTVTLEYSLVGAMLNAVLPMRAGDVARALLLSRRHRIRLGDAGGMIAAERIGDALTVAGLGGALMLVLVLPTGTVDGLQVLAVALAGVATAIAIGSRPSVIRFARQHVLGLLPDGGTRRVAAGMDGLVEAGKRLRQPGVLGVALVGHSFGWVAVLAALAACISALSIPVPPLEAAATVLVLTSVGGIVVQVPAGIGAWHMLAAAALAIWRVPLETGIAYAIVAHGIGVLVPLVLGAVASLRIGSLVTILRGLRAPNR